jgi:AraC-like DNA-binding protein/quercetin dioxygenase-like cupin family protein
MSHRATDRAEVLSFRTAGNVEVEVMRTWYRTQAFPRHTHPYFTVGIMLGGVGTLWVNGVSSTLRRGDVVVIAPGDVHTGGLGEANDVLSYTALHLPPELVARAADSRGLPRGAAESIGSFVAADSPLADELRRVNAAVTGGRDPAAAESAMMRSVDSLLDRRRKAADVRESGTRRGEPAFVRTVLSRIEDWYADHERTSLEALASAAGVSPFHLVREFTRVVGLSPHRYVIQTRVRRAGELLAAGVSISDVADTVGFVDQSHLTNYFRRYVGATPGAYQRKSRRF